MKTVVIILGFRRSGSTILAKSIGSHSKCNAIGEINYFFREINGPESPCGCGEKYCECDYWKSIIDEIDDEKGTDVRNSDANFNLEINNEISSLKNIGLFIPTLLFNFRYNFSYIKSKIANTYYLYNKLFEHSKSEILVDSSKSIFRALALASNGSFFKVKFKYIFLVRDGRAVLNSTQKGVYYINQIDGSTEATLVKPKTPEKEINRWRFTNVMYLILLRIFRKKSHIMIKHEDFCNYPEKTLRNICHFLNLDYEPGMQEIGAHENHILGGNTSRINAKEIRKDRENWRKSLNQSDLKKFEQRAAWLNDFFGYRR